MVFQMSQREIEIAKEKFEKIDCNKNGFINFEQLTDRINVFFGIRREGSAENKTFYYVKKGSKSIADNVGYV